MEEQEIRDWCVTGEERILGNVYNRPGHTDGETIITSCVVQVRRVGESRIPMALTESGSSYWLGTPSRRFGLDKAEAFVGRMASSMRPVGAPRGDGGGDYDTVLQGLPTAGDANRPAGGATLAVTCDKCGSVALATLADEVSCVNVAGGIRIDDPCPGCRGKLAARPGRYRLNDASGRLERVGDFAPQ
jgi:hypothetical protein